MAFLPSEFSRYNFLRKQKLQLALTVFVI